MLFAIVLYNPSLLKMLSSKIYSRFPPFGKNQRTNLFALYTMYRNKNNPTLKNISANKCPAFARLYTFSNSFFALFKFTVAESNPSDNESISLPRTLVSSRIELDIRFKSFTFCRKLETPSSYSNAGWPSCTATWSVEVDVEVDGWLPREVKPWLE